jgi:hypothetical protein
MRIGVEQCFLFCLSFRILSEAEGEGICFMDTNTPSGTSQGLRTKSGIPKNKVQKRGVFFHPEDMSVKTPH